MRSYPSPLSLLSLVSFLVASRLSHIRHLHRSRCFHSSPCPPRGGCPLFSDDDDGGVDVFAQYLKRLLMEIAIMLSILSLAASQFFQKA